MRRKDIEKEKEEKRNFELQECAGAGRHAFAAGVVSTGTVRERAKKYIGLVCVLCGCGCGCGCACSAWT
jgi:hypothetical protein